MVPSFDESLLQEIRALPTVEAAVGGVGGEAQLIDDDGDVIQFGGAPNFGFSVDPTLARFNSIVLREGDWPTGGDVAVDSSTASKKDIEIGEDIGVQGTGAVQRLQVSGIFDFSAEGNIGGATLAAFDLPTAQSIFQGGTARPDPRCGSEGTTQGERRSRTRSAKYPGTHRRRPGR